MTVKVVTDSTSDMPKDLARELGISIVPLYVYFGPEVFKDGVDITHDEFFRRLITGNVLPRTSQPSVGDFLDVYRTIMEAGDEVVSVHISSKLSGTVNSARSAAQELPDARIELVDTKLASLGLALVAKAAAEAAKAGASLQEVGRVAKEVSQKVDLFFVLDTLEYLYKGGRIGRAQALLGSLLSLKPVLKVVDGEIHPYDKVRSRARALGRLREIARDGGPYEEIAFIHEAAPGEVAAMGSDLQTLAKEPVITGQIGPVIGTYTGPGVVGLALRKP